MSRCTAGTPWPWWATAPAPAARHMEGGAVRGATAAGGRRGRGGGERPGPGRARRSRATAARRRAGGGREEEQGGRGEWVGGAPGGGVSTWRRLGPDGSLYPAPLRLFVTAAALPRTSAVIFPKKSPQKTTNKCQSVQFFR